MSTATIQSDQILDEFHGGWLVPASPYASFENALLAVSHFRKNQKPFLGTCGGFQHMIVEYARHILGIKAAGITEIDPDCAVPLVSALECALVDEAKNIWPVRGGLLDE